MRPTAVAPAILLTIGAVLGGAGLGGGVLRAFAGEGIGGLAGWTYVLVAGGLALGGSVWLTLCWQRRRKPFDRDEGPTRARTWLAAAAAAGTGTGLYSGALFELGNSHASTVVGFLVFLPVVLLLLALSGPLPHALLRTAVAALCAEEATQAAWSLSRGGPYHRWNDITFVGVVCGAAGFVGAIVLSTWRAAIVRWVMRSRRREPPAAPPPSRA